MIAGIAGLLVMAVSAAGPALAPTPTPTPAPTPDPPEASPSTAALPPWAELDWQRAEDADGCISREELVHETEEVLRRAAFSGEGPAALRVRGNIERDPRGRWAATLALETSDGRSLGTRDLSTDDSDCHALDESLSVVLSLMVDVDRARLEMLEHPVPVAPPAPPPVPPPVISLEATSAEAPPPPPSWGWEVAAGAVVGSGLLPGQPLGAQAGISLRPPRLPAVDVFGTLWWASALGGPLDVKMRAWTVGATACPIRRASAWFEIEVCAGAEGGRYVARPVDVGWGEQSGPLAELIAGPRLRARLGRGWQARLGIYGVVTMTRTRLVVANDETPIFTSTPVSPRVGLEMAWGTAQ